MRGASESLYEDWSEAKRLQFLDNINPESLRLQNLADPLLALASPESRIELGTPTKVSLSVMNRGVLDQHESNLLGKVISCRVTPSKDVLVCREEFLLKTAINNLVQNAIDFSTKERLVDLEFSVSGGRVSLMVKD